ncbi:hypothetical protein BB559_004040 [Furculomyces boomerangus]|uniref:PLD phosphodiesterase domain-containing protein n=1 Tax=Furculomyces boomerangus TaxID=61424 RepID=A0A2T9YH71_9FUNG|nr:hypothetical protein BB559_004040 [Furculomyces boomerangus]
MENYIYISDSDVETILPQEKTNKKNNLVKIPNESGSEIIDLEETKPKENHGFSKRKRYISIENDSNSNSYNPNPTQKIKLKCTNNPKIEKSLCSKTIIEKESSLEFPKGKVLLTNISDFPTDNSITFEKVIDGNNHKLQKAVMTTFVCDFEWLRRIIGKRLNLCLAMNFEKSLETATGPIKVNECTVLVNPPLRKTRYSVFHPKIMLLWYEGFVRLVIGSANLIQFDWTCIQNIVFIQDFPLLDSKRDLECGLIDLFQISEFPSQVIDACRYIDFTSFKHNFVFSIASSNDLPNKYGYLGLSQIVKSFGYKNMEYLRYQCSSLGFLDGEWVDKFCSSLGIKHKVQVLFPTQKQAEESALGLEGASSIILNKYAYKSDKFPHKVLYKAESKRPGYLSHSKIMYSRCVETDMGWLYLGSHNFTKAAWGTSKNSTEITLSNYESGVVFQVLFVDEEIYVVNDPNDLSDISLLPLPFSTKWVPYDKQDKPWIQNG